MIRGWYIGSSGMNAQQNRLDAISNNLANADTTAFKRDIAVSKSFPELLMRRLNDDGVYETPFGSSDVAPIVGKIGLDNDRSNSVKNEKLYWSVYNISSGKTEQLNLMFFIQLRA